MAARRETSGATITSHSASRITSNALTTSNHETDNHFSQRPSLRPASLPYDRRHAHKLTKIIWQQAMAMGIDPPFGLDRMSDRLVVRELKKVAT